MGCTPAGYVGVVRLEDGRLDVAMALDRRAGPNLRRNRRRWPFRFWSQPASPAPPLWAEANFRGTPYLTRRRGRVAADGLVVIGDAAGYVEPLTGEGMAWAMQQAIVAAPLISAAIARSEPQLTHQWQQQYEAAFRYRRTVCRAASWLRRNYRFGDLVLGLLARMPGLAAPWVRAVNRPAPQIFQSAPIFEPSQILRSIAP